MYDFLLSTFGWWAEVLKTDILPWGAALAEKTKLVFRVNTGAAVLGLGYIVGLKYSTIICAGSLLVWWVIIPLMGALFPDTVLALGDPNITTPVGAMSADTIFTTYARHIGIGGIAMAGVIGIVRSWGVIKGAVGLASRELGGKRSAVQGQEKAVARTDRDISMKFILIASVIALAATFLFFTWA